MSDAPDAAYDFPHSVYRIFDRAGRLVYIGCAADVDARVYMHRWTDTMADAALIAAAYDRHETVEYPSRVAARAAERAAIQAEGPMLNRQHNPTRWQRRAGRYVSTDAQAYVEFALSILGPRPACKGWAAHDDYLALLDTA